MGHQQYQQHLQTTSYPERQIMDNDFQIANSNEKSDRERGRGRGGSSAVNSVGQMNPFPSKGNDVFNANNNISNNYKDHDNNNLNGDITNNKNRLYPSAMEVGNSKHVFKDTGKVSLSTNKKPIKNNMNNPKGNHSKKLSTSMTTLTNSTTNISTANSSSANEIGSNPNQSFGTGAGTSSSSISSTQKNRKEKTNKSTMNQNQTPNLANETTEKESSLNDVEDNKIKITITKDAFPLKSGIKEKDNSNSLGTSTNGETKTVKKKKKKNQSNNNNNNNNQTDNNSSNNQNSKSNTAANNDTDDRSTTNNNNSNNNKNNNNNYTKGNKDNKRSKEGGKKYI